MSDADNRHPGDETLVAAALEGNARAFERLLGRYEVRVLRTLRLLGVGRDDREDVAQEVFVRVFRYLDRYRPRHPFSGWLYRVTVNAAHDHRLRMARRARGEAPWRQGLEETAGAEADTTARAVERRDLREALEAALELLSERERAVFVLRELEGLETLEVARALGITRVTVRRHLSLARRRLRQALRSDGRSREPEKKSRAL